MDQATDELAEYFDGRMPKICVTTSVDAIGSVRPDWLTVILTLQLTWLFLFFPSFLPFSFFFSPPPSLFVFLLLALRRNQDTIKFAEALINVFPTAEFHHRRQFGIKKIIAEAIEKGYTDLVVVNEDRKKPTGLLISHLPNGPTLHFKVSSIVFEKDIANHGKAQGFYPG